MQNRMKALLRQGKAVFSCTIRTPHPNLAEIAGLAGYECVMLDAEHGTVSSDTLDAMILAVRATGATPIVRVPGVDRTLVKQALDHGAGGILFPHIASVEDAREAVSLCKYPPQGKRGAGPRAPHRLWAGGRPRLPGAGQRPGPGGAHAGEPSAVEQLEAIAAVPGIDIFNMGPWDLSTAYGHPIETRHPLVLQALDKALKVGRQHGIQVGVSPENEEDVKQLYDKGARFFESVNLEGFVAERLADYRRTCQP